MVICIRIPVFTVDRIFNIKYMDVYVKYIYLHGFRSVCAIYLCNFSLSLSLNLSVSLGFTHSHSQPISLSPYICGLPLPKLVQPTCKHIGYAMVKVWHSDTQTHTHIPPSH